MMWEMTVPVYPIEKDRILNLLAENNISVNEYAKSFLMHPSFDTNVPESQVTLVFCSLKELGFPHGAVLEALIAQAATRGLFPCRASTGIFLRLSYRDQPKSRNRILSGTHHAPDSAITVLSEFLEENDGFPKGLYLRNVDGHLWLRGYVCDKSYVWSEDDIFVFQKSLK